MASLYRSITILFIGILLSAAQCTKTTETSDGRPGVGLPNLFQESTFFEDTVLIQKFCDQARQNLHQDVARAMQDAKQALKLSQKYHWEKGRLVASNLISTCYLLDGGYDELRETANETFKLAGHKEGELYTAHAHRFLGESFSEYQEYDSARVHFNKAISIFARLDQDSARALCLESLGTCFRGDFQYDSATTYYDQAAVYYAKINSRYGEASLLQSRGYLHIRTKEYKKAQALFLKSYEKFVKLGNVYGQLNVMNDLSNAYNNAREFAEGEKAALKAIALSEIYHSDQQSNWALTSAYRSARGQNKLTDACDYLERVTYAKRRLHDGSLRRQFTMYQLMYENEQMGTAIQQQIIDEQRSIQRYLIAATIVIVGFAIFLWFNNKTLRRKNAEIKEALVEGQKIERQRVAAELHDHLGGTLASLNWYLHGVDKKSLSAEEQKIVQSVHEMVGAAYQEVRSLSHNLIPAELTEHGLVAALRRLVDKLNESKLIRMALKVEGMAKRLHPQAEFELYGIILELSNNIFKHSGATAAEIRLIEEQKFIRLEVSDDGTGITGTSKDGLGLMNIRSRVNSLSGKIDIRNRDDHGTIIVIDIPKATVQQA